MEMYIIFGGGLILSWTKTSKKYLVLRGRRAELIAVGAQEGSKGENLDRLLSGHLVFLYVVGGSLDFVSEENFLVGVS